MAAVEHSNRTEAGSHCRDYTPRVAAGPRRSLVRHLLAAFPSLVVGAFGLRLGTFFGGAGALETAVGWILLLGFAGLGASEWRDPWRLGRAGLAVWLIWPVLVTSLLASPVPRAGSTGVLLAPLFLLVPSGVARCWSSTAARRTGATLLAILFSGAMFWALADRFLGGSERAAMPLGHHNLLAVWIVTLWPLAALPIRAGGKIALLGWIAGSLGIVTLVATGSLAGWLGLSLQMALGVWGVVRWMGRKVFRRLQPAVVAIGLLLAAAAMAGLATQGSRLLEIVAQRDTSTSARWGYMRAAGAALSERPLVGFGPGSSSWLLAEHLHPVPAVHPAHELVTDLHSLPAEILFELGLGGLAVAALLVVLVAARCWRAVRVGDPSTEAGAVAWSATVALAGMAGAVCWAGLFDVTALYVAPLLALGLLASTADRFPTHGSGRWAWCVCAILMLALVPRGLAHARYDRYRDELYEANRLEDPETTFAAVRGLQSALRWDPNFPLYRFELAQESGGRIASDLMERAAWTASGVAPLWLQTGVAAAGVDPERAERSLVRACDLDPLGGIAPYLLVELRPEGPLAIERATRALLAEPRLIAASLWRGREPLLRAAGARLLDISGVDAGWRLAVSAAIERRLAGLVGAAEPGDQEPPRLSLRIDERAETSVSLFAFRRRPLERILAVVDLDPAFKLPADLPSAWGLEDSSSSALATGCLLADTEAGQRPSVDVGQ